jgi:hypothetical protein
VGNFTIDRKFFRYFSIHNNNYTPNKGGQIVRSAGTNGNLAKGLCNSHAYHPEITNIKNALATEQLAIMMRF